MPRSRPGTTMDTIDRGASPADAAARFLTWLSPAFPVGSFSYSHGLEYAVEAGLVSDRSTLITWIEGILRHGAGRLDAHQRRLERIVSLVLELGGLPSCRAQFVHKLPPLTEWQEV